MAKKKDKKKISKKKGTKGKEKKKKLLKTKGKKKTELKKKDKEAKDKKRKGSKKKDIQKKKKLTVSPKTDQKAGPPADGFSDHSSYYNVRDALQKLRTLTSAEQVRVFTKGEKRTTITRAITPVMNRIQSQ